MSHQHEVISSEQVEQFHRDGFLHVPGVIGAEELDALREAADQLIEAAEANGAQNPDCIFGKGARTGQRLLKRIEYVVDKKPAMKLLMGHPFLLRTVETILGRDFIPTWDSMVVKMPGEGLSVPWHRDDEPKLPAGESRPIFNVDVYLDDAGIDSCLWVIPGSHKWTSADAAERVRREGFSTDDAIPVPLKAGDVILHNVMVLHGSPDGTGNNLRRTVYYEFRPSDIERDHGPHTAAYIPLKQRLLAECLRLRAASPPGAGEKAFTYQPGPDFPLPADDAPLETFRFPHERFWREGTYGGPF